MPTSNHKIQPADRTHWSRVQAAVIARFNWPAKSKVNPKLVVRMASEVADLAVNEYRTRRNGSRK